MRILVTGATGFVGSAVLRQGSLDPALELRGSSRNALVGASPRPDTTFRGELDPETDWTTALNGIDVVVHTAALVHQAGRATRQDWHEFRRVNVDGTLALARQAAHLGVKRFVFMSSVKVNGEETKAGRPFTASDPPNPTGAYAWSKSEGEARLRDLAATTGLELVILRPTLVYGPGVGANFRRMMQSVYRGIPLPFGAVANKRSLIGLENLVDLVLVCAHHPAAAGHTLMASDGNDVSTTSLLRKVGHALDRPARLVSVSPRLLGGLAWSLGRRETMSRLLGSLQVDITETKKLLDWVPPFTLDHGMRSTAEYFLDQLTANGAHG
jgi:nucleoside-diphosphate-sugar epimerase